MSDIYFTGEDLNGIPKIFTYSQYNFWHKDLMEYFFPVLINTTHENVHF